MNATPSEQLQGCLQRLHAYVQHGDEQEQIDRELRRIACAIGELPLDEQRRIREAVRDLKLDRE